MGVNEIIALVLVCTCTVAMLLLYLSGCKLWAKGEVVKSADVDYKTLIDSKPHVQALCGLLCHFRKNETTVAPDVGELRLAMMAFDELPKDDRVGYLETVARICGLAATTLESKQSA